MVPTRVSLYHRTPTAQVWSLQNASDPAPKKLGAFVYETGATASAHQTFRITGTQRVQTPSSLVTLDVRENHGHDDFTCVFRFRVHSHDLT